MKYWLFVVVVVVGCSSDNTSLSDGGDGSPDSAATDATSDTATNDTGADSGTCAMPKTICGNACVDLQSDNGNCGMCGLACTAMISQCTKGMCCPTGQVACAGKCVDTMSDTANCGMCGMACSGNKPACIGGQCAPLPTFVGPKVSFPETDISGWTLCYEDLYSDSGASLTNKILAQCTQTNLMLACRQTGKTTILVAAHAPRTDVIFATGPGNTGHDANGSTWYYDPNSSWGFALQGDPLDRLDGDGNPQCDTSSATNPGKRICWNAGSSTLTAGWRCGTTQNLNANNMYERLIYQAP